MLKTMTFIVSGRVQGVGFRYGARNQAVALGLTGWVRNRANGEVEGIVQGRADKLSEFASWLWDGPEFARVSAVKCENIQRESIADFQITQ